MVTANPFNLPFLPEEESQLQLYLECMIKDRLFAGADKLFSARIQTIKQRIEDLPALLQKMSQAADYAEIEKVVQ